MKLVAAAGLTELSVQERLTWLALAAVAVRLEGAAGTAGVVTVAVFDGPDWPAATLL